MEKVTKYVVVKFYAPKSKHYSGYSLHIYSYASGNRQSIINYCHKVRQQKGYKNDDTYKWYIMTEEKAREEARKLRKWQEEEERKDLERRYPVRYIGRTAREEIAEMMTTR